MKQYKANGHAMPVKSDGVTKLQSDESPVHTDQIIRQKGTVTITLMYGKGTKGVPLVYGECTGGVLKRYQKGTEEVLKKYQKGTKDIPALRTSLVARLWFASRGSVGAAYSSCAAVIVLVSSFCLFNVAAFGQSRTQSEAAAEVVEVRPLQIGDTIPGGHKATPYANEVVLETTRKNTEFDLDRFPMEVYEVDESLITPLIVGDSIPQELWNMPLQYVQKGDVLEKMYLKDFADKKLIVLDYWAQWCSPCIRSMDKWEGFVSDIGDDIAFLGVLIDYQHKALPVINERKWTSRSIIGLDAHILVRFFFDRAIASRLVWIMDGKFIGVTGTSGYTLEQVKEMMEDGVNRLVQAPEFTYDEAEGGSGE